MRVLLLLLAMACVAPSAAGREVEVARLQGERAAADLVTVRAADDASWIAADAIRKQPEPSWWRLRLAPDGADDSPWILAIKEAYDGELVAYLPPDYRALPLSTFDPQRRQIGSRHRMTLELAPSLADAPVYVQLIVGRSQPMRVSAAPLADYIADDLSRVRFTSMILSALLLLGVVAAIYAVALRRWLLLLFAVWVASASIYVLVMTGEVVSYVRDPGVLRHAMIVSGVAVNIGMLAVFGFIVGFLEISTYYPRLARVMYAFLALTALLIVMIVIEPRSPVTNQLINVSVLSLSVMSLAAAAVRARRGSPQGWFFLLGWGSLTVAGMARAGYFLQREGTPDWLEIVYPLMQVFGALVLVLATARAARYAEREMHVARSVARTDALTRLPNRAQLDLGLAELLRQSARDGQPFSLMFLDLDHFKAINDRYGHAVGDRCLAAVGNILRRHVRASDLIARYGGEEFVLALEGAGHERTAAAAEGLRAAVQEGGLEIDGQPIALTASIGVTDHRAGDRVEDLLARADAALYRAKREGRNRVVVDFAV